MQRRKHAASCAAGKGRGREWRDGGREGLAVLLTSGAARLASCVALLAACAALLAPVAASAQAGHYPDKPIRLYVGFAAGGGADTFMRLIAKNLTVALDNPVLVVNQPGANANIAADKVAHAAPDGYTLMMASVPNAVNATLYDHLEYDPARDFAPVIGLGAVQLVLTVAATSPYHSVGELIAGARAHPDTLSFSSGGVGSLEHLSGLAFAQAAGIRATHVPYKGSGASLTDLISGRISFAFNSMPSVLPQIASGKLRALAVADTQRSRWLPDTPSMPEAGLKNFAPERNWYGVVVPAGTPQPIITRLNGEMNKILDLPDVKALMDKMGAMPIGGTPVQFGKMETDETAKYARLIKAFDLHPSE
jgi:tripartite-type tricarboxylate transporter receptor subunit TctC